MVAVEVFGRGGEVERAEAGGLIGVIGADPLAVLPGAEDKGLREGGVVSFDGVEGAQCAGLVFGVEPAADGEDGAVDVVEMGGEVARLPVVVVSGVLDGLVEPGIVDELGEAAELGTMVEEIFVTVIGRVGEVAAGVAGREVGSVWPGVEEAGVELELSGEHEGAVVVGVVAEEEVGDGGLRGGGFDGGVGIDDGGGGVEAGVGHAPDAGFAVVAQDVF